MGNPIFYNHVNYSNKYDNKSNNVSISSNNRFSFFFLTHIEYVVKVNAIIKFGSV